MGQVRWAVRHCTASAINGAVAKVAANPSAYGGGLEILQHVEVRINGIEKALQAHANPAHAADKAYKKILLIVDTPGSAPTHPDRKATEPQSRTVMLTITALFARAFEDEIDDHMDYLAEALDHVLLGDRFPVEHAAADGSSLIRPWIGHFGHQAVTQGGLDTSPVSYADTTFQAMMVEFYVDAPWCPPEPTDGDLLSEIEVAIQAHDQGVLADVHVDGPTALAPAIKQIITPED